MKNFDTLKAGVTLCLLLAFSFGTYAQVVDTWQQKTGIPGPHRHHPVNFTLDGYGYLLTGTGFYQDGTVLPTKDFYRYDPQGDSWTLLSNFPGAARGFAVGLSVDGKGYIGFGAGSSNFNDLWVYDPDANSWQELASCPCLGRTHPAFISIGNTIYVGLGNQGGQELNDWWAYDIATDSWEQKADFPSDIRHHPYYFAIDNYGYVGMGHSFTSRKIYKDFYRYDPALDQWTRLNDLPAQGRVAGTHFTHEGKGYILCGQDENHRFFQGEFWQYTPELDAWLQMPTFPSEGRWAPGSFVIDDVAYLTCGEGEMYIYNDLWSFQLPTPSNTNSYKPLALDIYPNPAQGELFIKDSEIIPNIKNISIFDVNGVRHSANVQQERVNISGLPSGIYTIQVHTGDDIYSNRFSKIGN